MRSEILKVIEKIVDGEISPEDGATLIEAICQKRDRGVSSSVGKILVVEVTGDEKLKVRVPLKILKTAKEFVPLALSFSGGNLSEDVLNSIKSALDRIGEGLEYMEGDIVNIEDGEDRIRIYLE